MAVVWWDYRIDGHSAWGKFLNKSRTMYRHGHGLSKGDLVKVLIAAGYEVKEAIRRGGGSMSEPTKGDNDA